MTVQQRKMLGVLVTAALVGFCFVGVRSSRRAVEAARRAQEGPLHETRQRTKTVVFAREHLKVGQPILEESLEVKEVSERDVPKQDHATALDQVVGRLALSTIYHGEPLLRARIGRPDELPGALSRLEPGMQSVALRLATAAACGGSLRADDRVDVVGTVTFDGRPATCMLAVRARVLAARATSEPDPAASGAWDVTLQLAPGQVARVVLGAALSAVRLVAAPGAGAAEGATVEATAAFPFLTQADLFPSREPEGVPPREPAPSTPRSTPSKRTSASDDFGDAFSDF